MFFYADGQAIRKGDIVKVFWGDLDDVQACVEGVFLPGTKLAEDLSCFESGGVLFLETGNPKAFGRLLASPVDGKLDEDFTLIKRAD